MCIRDRHLGLQVAVLAVMIVAFGDGLQWTWLWLPLALVWTLLLQYTLALALAAFGCYLRDLQHLVPVAMSGLLFLSPVFYPSHAAPVPLALVLTINPISAPIELFRMAWFGDPIDTGVMVAQGVGLLVALVAARWAFARLRPGFADLV